MVGADKDGVLREEMECPKNENILRATLNSFKIIQFADLHFGDSKANSKGQEVMAKLIDFEKPDLVIFSGDQVSGWRVTNYSDQFDSVVAPLVARKIPFASILGNHDGEADLTRKQIMCYDSQKPGSATLASNWIAPNGIDYLLPIMTSTNKTMAWLLLMDSGKDICEGETDNAGCISSQQISWLTSTFTPSLQGTAYTTLLFSHQPIPEFNHLFHYYPTFGSRKETSGCPRKNTGVYQSLPMIDAIVSGHDHDNDYFGQLGGMGSWLMYGRKTGYGSYGPNYAEHGARVFELYDDRHFTTWIRQESGSIIATPPIHLPAPFWFAACGEESTNMLLIIILFILVGVSGLLFIYSRIRNKLSLSCRFN